VMDKEIANQPYRATFKQESLSEILRLLQLSAPIRYVNYNQETANELALKRRKVEVYKLKK